MLVQQKIAINKSISDTTKILSDNWSVIPLLFIFVFYKIAMNNFNNQFAPLFISIPVFFTSFVFAFNPFVRKMSTPENKLSKKIFIIGLLLTIAITVLSYFHSKKKTEEENKIFVEKISYGLLIFNYIIFLIFNVFFRYSGLNILSQFNIKVSEEINTKYTFFFFIAIFMLIIFTVSQPKSLHKSINNKFIKDNGYGILLISPLVLLLISYGINIFRKDKSLLLPYIILCICTLMYIINSVFSLGYKNEILDNVNNEISKLTNTEVQPDKETDKTNAIKKLKKENLLYEKKINGIKKITSKIPVLFSLITFLIFLVYSIKIKTNPISASLLLLFCFTIYLSFVMGTTYSNYNINNNLKNKIYKVDNFYWGKEDTKKNYEMLMLAVIIIGVVLAFSYGYINFFSRSVDTKNYIIKTIIGFIILAISSFFSYNWGMNIAAYNSPVAFDDENLFEEINKFNKRYNDILNNEQDVINSNININISNEPNNYYLKKIDDTKIIIGELNQYDINDFYNNNQCTTYSMYETSYKYKYADYIKDINDSRRGLHYYNFNNNKHTRDENSLFNIPNDIIGRKDGVKTVQCSSKVWAYFNDDQNYNSFNKNIIISKLGIENIDVKYKKYFEDNPSFENNKDGYNKKIEYYKEKINFLNEILDKIQNIDTNSNLTLNDLYFNKYGNKDEYSKNNNYFNIDTTNNNLKKICFNILNEKLSSANTEIKNIYIDNINNMNSNKTTDTLFSYSNILTVGLLFFGIILLSNLKFKYDTIYDVFSITGNSGDNVFNLLYSVFIILSIFSIGIKIESANKSDLISKKQIVPSILNSVLALLYVSTLLVPGLIKKIAFYVIVLLIHLSMFTIPLNEFKNKLSTNIIFLYIVLMSAIGISTYQVLTPSKNKFSSLYMLLIICAVFLTLHSAPSIFYLGDKDSENSENNLINPEIINEIRESANNSWPVLIFGLVLGFILFSKIVNPYSVGKLNLTPSKDFFFAKDNM